MLSRLPERRHSKVFTSIVSKIRDGNCTSDGTCEEQPPSNECHGSLVSAVYCWLHLRNKVEIKDKE